MHFSHSRQQLLARAGRGIAQEVAVLQAVQQAGLTSMFYCATRTQARLAADTSLDHICLNLVLNVGGAMAHHTRTSIRSEEHTSELPSLMRNSYAVFSLKK